MSDFLQTFAGIALAEDQTLLPRLTPREEEHEHSWFLEGFRVICSCDAELVEPKEGVEAELRCLECDKYFYGSQGDSLCVACQDRLGMHEEGPA